MEITRKLFNPYNKIWEVQFSDGLSIHGTYSIIIKPTEGFTYLFVDILSNKVEDDLQYYRRLAMSAIREHISKKMSEHLNKNFLILSMFV